jgi:TPR repeat protein
MAHEVFISHSSLDKPVADAVCAALENIGIRCWIAPRDVRPGLSFAGEITRAIEQSKVMVLIFSAHSNTSAQILREVQLAANSHLHIVQFRIENVVPNDDLEYYLSTPHWLDALTPPLEANLQHLGTSVKALLEMAPEELAEDGMMPVAPLDSRAERSRQDNVATVKDLTTPISAIAASKEPKAWRRKGLIIVTAGGAAVMLLFTITVLLMRPHPSVRKAAHLDQKGVDEGDAAAQNNLGMFYTSGEGVPKDLGKAAELFKKAADQGYAAAQNNLGVSYENGEGVPKDLGKAAELFKKAADQGYPKAQYNLGVDYASGEGVPKDLGKAAELFKKAADQGYPKAQYNLGVCYASGEGVPKDLGKAAELFQKAADQGDAKAQYELRFLSNTQIESLRSFEFAFIDEFAVPGGRFNAAAFEARVSEGYDKFTQAIANEKQTWRVAVLVDLRAQFQADAEHLRSKASGGKVTPALASEMKTDVNKIYTHALGP